MTIRQIDKRLKLLDYSSKTTVDDLGEKIKIQAPNATWEIDFHNQNHSPLGEQMLGEQMKEDFKQIIAGIESGGLFDIAIRK